ncbi:MAG: DUF4097 domain-containing protein [Clostridiales bacterium]|nr:DUF4097 domain-containing protein [Clostridiales bacterium]
MKEKLYIYNVETDVNCIELNLKNASVEICEAADEKFYIEYPNAKNIFAANNENGIIIHQGKQGIFSKSRQIFKIFVPAHTVPSIKIFGKDVELCVKNGIYGELSFVAEDGKAELLNCVLESAEIAGGTVDVHVADATVKSGFTVQADKGDVLAENTFFKRAEARVKRGNIGIVNVNCKDCAFDTQKGNITANLAGDESGFNTSLLAREGTANRESAASDGADGSFHAYTKKGNIVLDFSGEPQITPSLAATVAEETFEKEKENA